MNILSCCYLADLFLTCALREYRLTKEAQQKQNQPLSVANKPATIAPEIQSILVQIAKYKVEPYVRNLVYQASKQLRGQYFAFKNPEYMTKLNNPPIGSKLKLLRKAPAEIARRQTARVVGKAFSIIAIIEVAEALIGIIQNSILSFLDKVDVLIGILYEIAKSKPSDDLVQMARELSQYTRGIPEFYSSLQLKSMGPQQLAAFRGQINAFQQFLQSYQPKFMAKFSAGNEVAAIVTNVGSMKGQAELAFAGIDHDLNTMLGEIERVNHAAKDGDDSRMNRPEGTV
jgi:hypothetical protein